MSKALLRGLFITATDTGAGKTVAAAMIARELRKAGVKAGCYKPVCSGSERAADGSRRWADVDALRAVLGDEFPPERICPQAFDAPLAPPSAARLAGCEVDKALLRRGATWWAGPGRVEVLLVEGVGGLLCPIAADETVADLVGDLGFPLLIVSPLILGTINHTLLTIDAAQHRGLNVAGVLFNDVAGMSGDVGESTVAEIGARTTAPLLGTIAYSPDPQQAHCRALSGESRIDWNEIIGESCLTGDRGA